MTSFDYHPHTHLFTFEYFITFAEGVKTLHTILIVGNIALGQ